MSDTYSTLQRAALAGQLYSTLAPSPPQRSGHRPSGAPPAGEFPEGPRVERPTVAPRVPAGMTPVTVPPGMTPLSTQPAPAPAAAPVRRLLFPLLPIGLTPPGHVGSGATGSVRLVGRDGEPYQVEAELEGMPVLPDPALQPTLWLIHDLVVPEDLDPADLAALPRGQNGLGNRPGSVFTVDGNPPTYGPGSNTISVVVSPGRFSPTGLTTYRLETTLGPANNQTFHPLVFAGPEALADMNAPLPSGSTARVLTDLFMRPFSLLPGLPVGMAYAARLRAVTAQHLESGAPASFLDGSAFTRAAVTLEGLVRAWPALMPTQEASLLVAMNREEE